MAKIAWRTVLAAVLFPLSLLGLVLVGIALFFVTLPDVQKLKGCMTTSMYNVRLCPGSSQYSPLNQISADLINAVVASEDAAFFSHQGFDWHEIRESFTANLRQRGFKRGGSTLTQQLAKNVFLTKDKSILRKLREAALTLEIEKNFSKNEILERYLNVVEFGPNLYGIRPAAQYYFGKSPAQLHVLESAFLAFLLPNPKGYSKSFQQKSLTPFARKGIRQIINRLASFRKISSTTAQEALNNLDQFPWSHLTQDSFNGEPTTVITSPSEEAIESVYKEEVPTIEENVEPDSSEAEAEESSTWD